MNATLPNTANIGTLAPLSTLRRGDTILHDGSVFILFEVATIPNGGNELGWMDYH